MTLSVTYGDFAPNTTIVSSQMDQNFDDIESWANGNIGQDNFATLTGAVNWSVSSNVFAINISNSGTEGSLTISQSGVLASTKSALKVASASNQTSGAGLVDAALSASGATIPVIKLANAGTGSGVEAAQSGVLATGKAAVSASVSGVQVNGKGAIFAELTNASSTIPAVAIEQAGSGVGVRLKPGTGDAIYIHDGTNPLAVVDSSGRLRTIGAYSPGWTSNLAVKRTTTTNSNDSVFITGAEGTSLSASNPGYITLPHSNKGGELVVFKVTANVTILLSGAHWGADGDGDLTNFLCRVYAINDDGALKWGVGHAKFVTIVNTDTNTTQSSVDTPTEMIVNSALASGTWPCVEVGWAKANFTDSTNVFAIQTSNTGAYPADADGDIEVIEAGGNGHGSGDTAVRRFSTTERDNASEFIFNQNSAGNGHLFKIMQRGLYGIEYYDRRSGAGMVHGVSVNTTTPTTSINGIAASERKAQQQSATAFISQVSCTLLLNPGDIVRAHTDGTPDATDASQCRFAIRLLRRA
jgi:hypothetical protein